MQIPMDSCKKTLSVVWFVGAVAVFGILFLQSLVGHYEGGVAEAWGCVLPMIIPTLSLMVGVHVSDVRSKRAQKRMIDRFVFRLATFLSIVYLVGVLLAVLLQPVIDQDPLRVLATANLGLGPFQGLVVGVLGAFFVQKQ